jgi:hypothetical protein
MWRDWLRIQRVADIGARVTRPDRWPAARRRAPNYNRVVGNDKPRCRSRRSVVLRPKDAFEVWARNNFLYIIKRGEHYRLSMAIGERNLLPAVRSAPEDALLIADGFSCREQIFQSTGRRALHLAEILDGALTPSDPRRYFVDPDSGR